MKGAASEQGTKSWRLILLSSCPWKRSRTPLTGTYKRIIVTDAETENSYLEMFSDNKQQRSERRRSQYGVVSQLSVRRDCAWGPTVCVIVNFSFFCTVSGAPLWPYASPLLFTLNGHWHTSPHMLRTHTQSGNISFQTHIFIQCGQGLHIKLRASSHPLRLSILGQFSFLSGQAVKCVIEGKLNASAWSV